MPYRITLLKLKCTKRLYKFVQSPVRLSNRIANLTLDKLGFPNVQVPIDTFNFDQTTSQTYAPKLVGRSQKLCQIIWYPQSQIRPFSAVSQRTSLGCLSPIKNFATGIPGRTVSFIYHVRDWKPVKCVFSIEPRRCNVVEWPPASHKEAAAICSFARSARAAPMNRSRVLVLPLIYICYREDAKSVSLQRP